MKIKISWDDGATFERTCDLTDAIQVEYDREFYEQALAELTSVGRFWFGGGAQPIGLMVRA